MSQELIKTLTYFLAAVCIMAGVLCCNMATAKKYSSGKGHLLLLAAAINFFSAINLLMP